MPTKELSVEEITSIIKSHPIYETSDKVCQMYRVGDCTALVVINRDNNENVLSASCKAGFRFKKFFGDQAKQISNACRGK